MDNKTIGDFEKDNSLNIEEVINIYNYYIYLILKNSMINKEDIEEILSDVFVILWKNYERLDKNMEVKLYLVGIVKNLIKKRYRKLNKQNSIENIIDYEEKLSDYIDVEDLAQKNEKSKIISETLNEVKKEEKQIFMMFYYNSKKIKEISKELKISESKIKVILHRLRKKIRKKLKERGYNYGE